MPQLDISTFGAQIFWLLVFFLFIFVFSTKVTLPRLNRKLHSRWLLINDAEQEAEKLQQSITEMTSQFTQQFEQAKKDSQELITQTMADINRKQAQQKADFEALYKNKLYEFDLELAAQRKALTHDIVAAADNITGQIIQHMLGNSAVPQNIGHAVEKSLNLESRFDE